MTDRARSWPLLIAGLSMLIVPLSGCLEGDEAANPGATVDQAFTFLGDDVASMLASIEKDVAEGVNLHQTITINIVQVGTPEYLIDEEAFLAEMGPFSSPEIPFDRETAQDRARSPMLFEFDYQMHRAPAEFGRDLFAYADSIAEEVPADDFLLRYDDMYELGRIDEGDSIYTFDAPSVEQWMADHRADYGLDFEKPEYTIFILDSYTEGYWHHESFYYYLYSDVLPGSEENSDNMRVWGGLQDFLMLDVSAAPNEDGNDNSAPEQSFPVGWLNPAPALEGTAFNDPPVWHYRDDGTASMGRGETEARVIEGTTVMAEDIRAAVFMRLVPTYLYPPVYKPVIQINMHLYHDGLSVIPKTLEEFADFDTMMDGLRQQVPWAEIRGELHTYVLPDDDPGMHEALLKAKAHGAGQYIPAGPLMNHIDGHPEQYTSNDPNVFDVKAFFFLFQGHQTIYLPVIVGGVALGDTDGHAWGTISNMNDRSYLNGGDPKRAFVGINLHEVGHFFGLRHPHDGDYTRPDESYGSWSNQFTWSTTASALSYRVETWTSDNMDRDSVARAHTFQNLRAAQREVLSTYHVLNNTGATEVPDGVATHLQQAQEFANIAHQQFDDGAWTTAVQTAIQARLAATDALNAAGGAPIETVRAGSWEGSGYSSQQVKTYALGDTGSTGRGETFFDYQQVSFSPAAESVTVRVLFENTEDSWGDLFVGWAPSVRDPAAEASFMETRVRAFNAFGVRDYFDEAAGDGAHVLETTIELDRFPDMRHQGRILVGTGSQGAAENAQYTVEVDVNYRDWGDGADAVSLSPDIDEDLLPSEAGALDPLMTQDEFLTARGFFDP